MRDIRRTRSPSLQDRDLIERRAIVEDPGRRADLAGQSNPATLELEDQQPPIVQRHENRGSDGMTPGRF
jgi:hypothetical protein